MRPSEPSSSLESRYLAVFTEGILLGFLTIAVPRHRNLKRQAESLYVSEITCSPSPHTICLHRDNPQSTEPVSPNTAWKTVAFVKPSFVQRVGLQPSKPTPHQRGPNVTPARLNPGCSGPGLLGPICSVLRLLLCWMYTTCNGLWSRYVCRCVCVSGCACVCFCECLSEKDCV